MIWPRAGLDHQWTINVAVWLRLWRPRLDEAIAVGEGIGLGSDLFESVHCLAERHAIPVTVRPAEHTEEGRSLLAIPLRTPQRPLIARQDYEAVLKSVVEDSLIRGALPEIGQVDDAHDRPAAPLKSLYERTRYMLIHE
jgi:hypothetical protein